MKVTLLGLQAQSKPWSNLRKVELLHQFLGMQTVGIRSNFIRAWLTWLDGLRFAISINSWNLNHTEPSRDADRGIMCHSMIQYDVRRLPARGMLRNCLLTRWGLQPSEGLMDNPVPENDMNWVFFWWWSFHLNHFVMFGSFSLPLQSIRMSRAGQGNKPQSRRWFLPLTSLTWCGSIVSAT